MRVGQPFPVVAGPSRLGLPRGRRAAVQLPRAVQRWCTRRVGGVCRAVGSRCLSNSARTNLNVVYWTSRSRWTNQIGNIGFARGRRLLPVTGPHRGRPGLPLPARTPETSAPAAARGRLLLRVQSPRGQTQRYSGPGQRRPRGTGGEQTLYGAQTRAVNCAAAVRLRAAQAARTPRKTCRGSPAYPSRGRAARLAPKTEK